MHLPQGLSIMNSIPFASLLRASGPPPGPSATAALPAVVPAPLGNSPTSIAPSAPPQPRPEPSAETNDPTMQNPTGSRGVSLCEFAEYPPPSLNLGSGTIVEGGLEVQSAPPGLDSDNFEKNFQEQSEFPEHIVDDASLCRGICPPVCPPALSFASGAAILEGPNPAPEKHLESCFSTPSPTSKRPPPTPSSSVLGVQLLKSQKVGEAMQEDAKISPPKGGSLVAFVQNQLFGEDRDPNFGLESWVEKANFQTEKIVERPIVSVATPPEIANSPYEYASASVERNILHDDAFLDRRTCALEGEFACSSSGAPAPAPTTVENGTWEEVPLTREEVYGSMSNLYSSFSAIVEGLEAKFADLPPQGETIHPVVQNLISQLAERVSGCETLATERTKVSVEQFAALESHTNARLTRLEDLLASQGRRAEGVEVLRTKFEELNSSIHGVMAGQRSELDKIAAEVRASRVLTHDVEALRQEIAMLKHQVGMQQCTPAQSNAEYPSLSPSAVENLQHRLSALEHAIPELSTRATGASRSARAATEALGALEAKMASFVKELPLQLQRDIVAEARASEHRLESLLTAEIRQSEVRARIISARSVSTRVDNLHSEVQEAMGLIVTRLQTLATSQEVLKSQIAQAIHVVGRDSSPQGGTKAVQGAQNASPSVGDIVKQVMASVVNEIQVDQEGGRRPRVTPVSHNPTSGVDVSSIPRVDRSRSRSAVRRQSGVPLVLAGGSIGTTATPSASASINEVRIAPVGATVGGMVNILPVQLSSALLGVMPAKFSGEPEDWPEWKRRWLHFLENVEEAMPTVTGMQILTLFKGVLDEASLDKLEAEQIADPDVGYDEFFALVDLEFGGDNVANLRSKWYGLRLKHQGSVRISDWRRFSALFFKLMAMVGDATEEEAERLLLRALPVEWRRKVEVEVDKRNNDGLLILEGLPSHLTKAQVQAFVTVETGVAPKTVESGFGGRWRIKGADDHHRSAIMQLSRQRLEGGSRLVVKQVEDRLKVRDIDQLMRRWLKVDERVSRAARGEPNRREDERKFQRFTREVVAEEEVEDESGDVHQVARVEVPKSRPQATETHPRATKDSSGGKGNTENKKDSDKPKSSSLQGSGGHQTPTKEPFENRGPENVEVHKPSGTSAPYGTTPGAAPTHYGTQPGQGGYGMPWVWHTPAPVYWDPSWAAAWYPGQQGAWSGGRGQGRGNNKGQGGKGRGQWSGGQWSGSGAGRGPTTNTQQ